jgi:hypothetical protein
VNVARLEVDDVPVAVLKAESVDEALREYDDVAVPIPVFVLEELLLRENDSTERDSQRGHLQLNTALFTHVIELVSSLL